MLTEDGGSLCKCHPCRGSLECAREILEAGTTDEALAVLDSYGILKETMAVVMEKIQFYLDHRSYEQILLGAVVFSNVYGLLGQTRMQRS